MRASLLLPFAFCAVLCAGADCAGADVPPLPVDDLGATLGDPILLTVAAARERAGFVVDEGATFSADDGIAFVTDTSGDLALGFVVNGHRFFAVSDLHAPIHVVTTTSDALVIVLPLTPDVSVELRFAAASGRVSLLDVVVRNEGVLALPVDVVVALRRCAPGHPGSAPVADVDRRFFAVSARDDVATLRFRTPVDPKLAVIGAGTYAEDFTGTLQVGGSSRFIGDRACVTGAGNELGRLYDTFLTDPARRLDDDADDATDDDVGLVGTVVRVEPAVGGARLVSIRRTVHADVDEPTRRDGVTAAFIDANLPDVATIVSDGLARLRRAPPFPADAPRGSLLAREARLLFRSCFVLLDQLRLPAAGDLDHDSFVFSREPSFWFGRLGQHAHEGLVLPMWARLDPEFARDALMNFVEHVEDDGYLPYNIGPIVTQRQLRTASAPLLCDVGERTLSVAEEQGVDVDVHRVALREACARTIGFWRRERDDDRDGMLSWGGLAISESLRDLHNPVWIEVADPSLLETADPNAMIVVEERALARLIQATSGDVVAARAAVARAAADVDRLQQLYDAERGFYFHRDAVDDDFDVEGRSLFRRDIGGLLPLWADAAPPSARLSLVRQLQNARRFGRDFGIPGIAADDESYDPSPSDCCKWDGPVWVPWNHLIARGLFSSGDAEERALALTLVDRTVDAVAAQLVRSHQFRETYHPDDALAANESMPNYVWSALVAEMMLEAGSSAPP